MFKRRRSITSYLLLTALLLGARAFASDWVGGDTVMFREVPGNRTVAPAPIPQSRKSDDGALSVTDPGVAGSPSDQHPPSALQGNVNQVNSSYAGTFFNGEARQPVLAAPAEGIVPPKVFQAWLQQTHPELTAHTKSEVINVKGQWDDSAHALHNFGILSTKISASKLVPESLVGTRILVIDCAGELNEAQLKTVREFVYAGGYLLTTDWALEGCLTRAIPGYINWNGGYSPKEMVDAREAVSDSTLLKGTPPRAYWNLEMKCQTVHVMKVNQVTILVRSNVLKRDDPDQLGILAATFNYGKGRVLHLVGHFDSNSDRAFNNLLPDPAPGIGISLRQAIAANFIAEALSSGPAVEEH
jgi:hypothetical protein